MEKDSIAQPVRRDRHKKRWVFVGGFLFISILVAGGTLIWRQPQATSLLPKMVAQKATGFTPYFYFKAIPAGYSLDTTRASFEDDILIVPLTKAGSPSIVLTEQVLPKNLDKDALQENGEKVPDAIGSATINSVEGRLVGTLIAADHKALILINAPGEMDKDDLKSLLQGLKPIRKNP